MPNLIATYNKHNQPTGHTMTITDALRKGAWCRGAHIIICTTDGHVLLQKRAASMVMHPSQIDMSAGGYVDAGETPEQAAVREVHEEFGISIKQRDLQLIKVRRQNHRWPKMRKRNRAFIYSYVVVLPSMLDVSHVQFSEVEWARFVPLATAKQFVRRRRLKALGRLEPKRLLYRDALQAAERVIISHAVR
jgi:8-oxo-dGTP pyrophosphatase MutT (NUDIX family)